MSLEKKITDLGSTVIDNMLSDKQKQKRKKRKREYLIIIFSIKEGVYDNMVKSNGMLLVTWWRVRDKNGDQMRANIYYYMTS